MQPDDLQSQIFSLCRDAKTASRQLAFIAAETINAALDTLADKIRSQASYILEENLKDISYAQDKGLTEAMIDRLRLDEGRLEAIASSIKIVRDLPCPLGKVLWETTRPNGLHISRIAVPIGVLGMIYESRPNVTIDAAILCLKSGNAVVLRGGSESFHSAQAFYLLIRQSLQAHDIPENAVTMIPMRDREAVGFMLKANDSIDVIIPRGGKGLIERIMREATMPVFGHLDGVCHIYVHPSAKPEVALNVTMNAKLRRTGVCGAMETLLLDSALDENLSKSILSQLIDAGCTIVGDPAACKLDPRITPASHEDWSTEYLDAKLSCKIVNGVNEAVTHINAFGSHHTDSILCEDTEAADYFIKHVDSGIVMHNASTQFADGGEFGMGAEIGIGTGKLHARGPVGIEQLCTYKYSVKGRGQTRP
jgi:glutamate-5-semialdehyde dehydrogenase